MCAVLYFQVIPTVDAQLRRECDGDGDGDADATLRCVAVALRCVALRYATLRCATRRNATQRDATLLDVPVYADARRCIFVNYAEP